MKAEISGREDVVDCVRKIPKVHGASVTGPFRFCKAAADIGSTNNPSNSAGCGKPRITHL
jgi:hypothetical protein